MGWMESMSNFRQWRCAPFILTQTRHLSITKILLASLEFPRRAMADDYIGSAVGVAVK
jgi:hypothetical protein